MCDPPLNSSHEVWPSPFGAHFHWWPSPLRPQSSPPRKNVPSLIHLQNQVQESNVIERPSMSHTAYSRQNFPSIKQYWAGKRKWKNDTPKVINSLAQEFDSGTRQILVFFVRLALPLVFLSSCLLSSPVFFLVFFIRRIRKYLTSETTQSLVHAIIMGRLDYCNSLLFNTPATHIGKLQCIQNCAARLVSRTPKIWPHNTYFKTSSLLASSMF